MKTLNQFQFKLLANFCSDIARGAILSGLGFPYLINASPEERIMLFISGIATAGIMLYLALLIAQAVEE